MEANERTFTDEFLERVFHPFNRMVFAIAHKMLNNGADDVKDVSQDVFLKLYKQFEKDVSLWDRFKQEADGFRVSYVGTAAKNAALECIRRKKSVARADAGGEHKTNQPLQERELFMQEMKDHVKNGCRVLTGVQKEALLLIMEDPDISNLELAAGLGEREKKIRYTIVPQLKENIRRCSVFRKYFKNKKGE